MVLKLNKRDRTSLAQIFSDICKEQLNSKMIHFEESQAFAELDKWITKNFSTSMPNMND